jgi:pyruvate dehydrogenase E1 component alpha subunit
MNNFPDKITKSDYYQNNDLEPYFDMVLARKFEEKVGQYYGMGLIAGFCHLYIGQEAVVTGLYHAIEKGDKVTTTYRDHAHIIASGIHPKYILAELFGKETGVSKGKGGSMHLFNKEGNFYGGHGIVGASVPIGAGLGFACKYKETKDISVTFFGDGAANQGQVYETLNMAKLWELPVIFIVENNNYAMGTAVQRASSSGKFSDIGTSFGIKGINVDGMDYIKVKDAMEKAVAQVRSGSGPLIVEMETYRYRGHSMSDPGNYRSREEIDKYKKSNDPIQNYKKHIFSKKIATEKELLEIDNAIKKIIEDSYNFAKDSLPPAASELFTNIYN